LKEWWKGFEINVLGTALVIQTYLRTKIPEKEGIVITLNSIAAHWGSVPNLSAYATSKAASLRMIELFQVESPEVRFVSIHPGAVETDMGKKSGLKGMPHTDPVLSANFILWSTSPEAEFLKGRFAWVNWDVEELKAKKQEILDKNLLQYSIAGFD
jgi:NAD(P)-dependent dehydrogenase (short-subunit alcohol dehydrogenase family)